MTYFNLFSKNAQKHKNGPPPPKTKIMPRCAFMGRFCAISKFAGFRVFDLPREEAACVKGGVFSLFHTWSILRIGGPIWPIYPQNGHFWPFWGHIDHIGSKRVFLGIYTLIYPKFPQIYTKSSFLDSDLMIFWGNFLWGATKQRFSGFWGIFGHFEAF